MAGDDFYSAEMTMGERLRRLRLREELSVAEVAAYLNKKEQVVIAYETDVKLPSFEDLWLLCLLYSCNLEYLCEPYGRELAEKNKGAACVMKCVAYLGKMYCSGGESCSNEDISAVVAINGYARYSRKERHYLLY